MHERLHSSEIRHQSQGMQVQIIVLIPGNNLESGINRESMDVQYIYFIYQGMEIGYRKRCGIKV